MTQRPTHVYEVYIRTTPERLWAAITSPEYTRRYFYGGWYESTWQTGDAYRTLLEDGTTPFEGTLLEVDPPRRLAYTFHYVGDEHTRPEHPSRVTWEIAPVGELCKLTLVHDQFAEGELATFAKVGGGWPGILDRLKSVLETSESRV
ncbi:MAG: SRPBCC family protein [Chloroflexota bacterium]|nr:SRPBCC family protein [Chloroflexota bacterium]